MFVCGRMLLQATRNSLVRRTSTIARRDLRFAFPEFLPDPEPTFRNTMAERLARKDMLRRRSMTELPEFYVGSVISITVSAQNAEFNKFVGIVIDRGGTGLRAWTLIRNVVDGEGIEIMYDLYSPLIKKIEVLQLERRLDDELYYLRDAPLEYSFFPFNTEAVILPEDSPVPLNSTIIALNPRPWTRRWEYYIDTLKGFVITKMDDQTEARLERLKQRLNPMWQQEVLKYDLLREYRHTIPIEEQDAIWAEVGDALLARESAMRKVAAQKAFVKPIKSR